MNEDINQLLKENREKHNAKVAEEFMKVHKNHEMAMMIITICIALFFSYIIVN